MDFPTVNTNSNTDTPVGCVFSYPAIASIGLVMLQFFWNKKLRCKIAPLGEI